MEKELYEYAMNEMIRQEYIDGNIDNFIKEALTVSEDALNKSIKSYERSNKDFATSSKASKDYVITMTLIIRKLELIAKILETNKLVQNKKDCIKLGIELTKVAEELKKIGEENLNE